jgi:RNA polymerase sigma factor (sigma-70 family)
MSTFTSPTTPPSLLLRIRDPQDGTSWELFETLYAPVVRNYCRRRGLQNADIEDIVQEVLISVARTIGRFDYDPAKGQFRGWFRTITANAVRKFFRKSSPTFIADAKHIESAVSQESELNMIDEEFAKRVLHVACSHLSTSVQPETWHCFWRTWNDCEPASVVADSLGIPIHSVYVNKSRVSKRLEETVRMFAGEWLCDTDGGDVDGDRGK